MQFDIYYGMNIENVRSMVPGEGIDTILDSVVDYVCSAKNQIVSLDNKYSIENKFSDLCQAILNLAAVVCHLTRPPDPIEVPKPRQIVKE